MFLLAAACRQQQIPPLPEVNTSGFLPSIREAIDAARADTAAKPNDAAANGRLGRVLHAHDQLGAAKACYRRASLLDERNFDWLYYLGVVEQASGDNASAAATFRQAIRLRDYTPAKLRLGDVLLATGDSAGAARIFENLTGTPAGAFGYARAANKPEYLEKAIKAFPKYGAAIFALARHYQRSGRTDDAARLMRDYPKFKTMSPPMEDPLMDAISALSAGPTTLLRRAMSLESAGDLRGAAALNERALALDPKLVQAHVNLVSAYGRLGDVPNAERHYREAIALNPNAAEAYYNFGVLRYAGGRKAEAERAFRETVRINPGYAEARANLGAILQERGDLVAAQREFETAVEWKPDLRTARFNLGRLYANRNDWDRAIAQFREIVAVDDDATPTYLYALGATLARAGKPEAAATLAQAREQAARRGQSALVASIDRDLARWKR